MGGLRWPSNQVTKKKTNKQTKTDNINKAGDLHTMKCLSAMQGTYWLVASHCGSPAFKQEPGKSPADKELLICFLHFDGVHGWYVLSDYLLHRAEFEDMAHNGKILAYFPRWTVQLLAQRPHSRSTSHSGPSIQCLTCW